MSDIHFEAPVNFLWGDSDSRFGMDSGPLLFPLLIGRSGLTPQRKFREWLRDVYNLGYSGLCSATESIPQLGLHVWVILEPENANFDRTHIVVSMVADPSSPRGVYAPTAEWGLAFNFFLPWKR